MRIVTVLLVIIVACVAVLALQIYDRWHNAEVKTAEQAQGTKTGETVGRAGAKISPSDPKLSVEPPSRVQKNPEQPANPG
jgi:hypothetical protein